MKSFIIFLILIIAISVANAQLSAPESIVWNPLTNSYIISDAANGKLVSLDKNGIYRDFTTGLNQPKGLTFDYLSIWVTDLREIVEIDAENGVILNRYNIIGSGSLNDIVTDDFGYLYITDTQNGRVYRFDTYSSSYIIFSKGPVPSANGIFYDTFGGLIVVSSENNAKIYSIDIEEGNVELMMQTQLGLLDGITYDSKRDRFYISSWTSNSVYTFDPSFTETPQLLRSNLNGPADIYYDSLTDTLCIPVMNTGQIVFIGFEDRKVEILGSKSVCESSASIYKAESSVGYSNKWSVTGGQIQGNANLDSCIILWGTSGSGKVKLVQTNLQTQVKDSSEINITIQPLPVVNILGNQITCETNTYSYFAQNKNGLSKLWSVSGGEIIGGDNKDTVYVQWNSIPENIDSTTISAFVSLTQIDNTTGCSNSNYIKVNVSKKPRPVVNGKLNVCLGDVEIYHYKYNQDNSYEWQISGGTIIGNDKDTILRVQWNQEGQATLSLIEANQNGCNDTARINVNINPLPEKPTITQNGTTLVSSSALSYQWLFEGNPIQGANQQSYMPVDSGSYQVEIADENGCKSLSDVFVYNPTDVEESLNNFTIKLYPEIASDMIKLSIITEGKYDISIIDILGNSVIEPITIQGHCDEQINVENLCTGIYFILIKSGNFQKVFKFIRG
jgi:hypothetical protein